MKYKVIRDTREQAGQGWEFSPSENCEGTNRTKLKTGDYTIEGFEGQFVIERKGTLGEFYKNITQGRFERELKRMQKMKAPFMILEFTLEDIMNFPEGSGIPRSKWSQLRVSKWYILKRLAEFEIKYKTKIILAGKHGKEMAASLFKRIIEQYGIEDHAPEGS